MINRDELIETLTGYGEEHFTTHTGIEIAIKLDADAEDPFDDCDEGWGIDLSNHRDYRGGEYGEALPFKVPEFIAYNAEGTLPEGGQEVADEMEAWMAKHEWTYVYMYDHSGRTVNTTGFSCQWDSGVAGVAFIERAVMIRDGWYGMSEETPMWQQKEKAEQYLKDRVQLLDDLMRGNVYWWSVEGSGEEESCAGYWGDSGRVQAVSDAVDAAITMEQKIHTQRIEEAKYRRTAYKIHRLDEDIRIDEDAEVLIVEGGAQVQAWVWVSEDEPSE